MQAPVRPISSLGTTLDILLADIAIRLQLSQAAYAKAVDRYEAIRKWIEREGSPVAGLVDLFYPQGSMAIGATIASRVTNDEHDLDIVVELRVPRHWVAEGGARRPIRVDSWRARFAVLRHGATAPAVCHGLVR